MEHMFLRYFYIYISIGICDKPRGNRLYVNGSNNIPLEAQSFSIPTYSSRTPGVAVEPRLDVVAVAVAVVEDKGSQEEMRILTFWVETRVAAVEMKRRVGVEGFILNAGRVVVLEVVDRK